MPPRDLLPLRDDVEARRELAYALVEHLELRGVNHDGLWAGGSRLLDGSDLRLRYDLLRFRLDNGQAGVSHHLGLRRRRHLGLDL
jgi:hypothetical protein